MTLTTTIEGTGLISNAESIANWNSITISAETLETNTYLQGSYAVSAQASNKAGELYCDVVAEFGRALDFDTSGTEEGQLLFMWITCTTLGLLDSVTNKGLTIRLWTDLTHWADWTIAGYDDLRNFRRKKGGFVCFALDPTLTPTYINTSIDIGNITWVGIHIGTTGLAKTQNVMIDTIIVGKGVRVTGTDTNGFLDMADYCTTFATRAWGMIQYDDYKAMIYSLGKIYIGSSSTATDLSDSSKYIKFVNTLYCNASSVWVPMVKDNYMGIDVLDGTTTNITTWQDGILVGTNNGRSGSTLEGNDYVTTYLNIAGLTNANSLIKLYNTKLVGINASISLENNINHQYFGCVFDECEQVDFGGANPSSRNCIFSNTVGASALLWYLGLDSQSCSFINNSVAILITTASINYSFNDMIFSGNIVDIENSSNATTTDSYAEANQDTDEQVGNGTITAAGQSFTGDGNILSRASLWLKKFGTLTGTAVCKIYLATGSDPNQTPTGSALATSNTITANDVTASYTSIEFEFEDEFTLVNTTEYFLVLEYNKDSSNYLVWGSDTSSPPAGSNYAEYTGSWVADSSADACFYIYTGGIVKIGLTDSNPVIDDNSGTPAGATIMPISVTLTIRGVKTGEEPNDYVRCAIYCKSGGDLPIGMELMNEEAQTVDDLNAGFYKATESFVYTNDQPVRYIARHENYEYIDLTATITIDGLDVKPPWIEQEVADIP